MVDGKCAAQSFFVLIPPPPSFLFFFLVVRDEEKRNGALFPYILLFLPCDPCVTERGENSTIRLVSFVFSPSLFLVRLGFTASSQSATHPSLRRCTLPLSFFFPFLPFFSFSLKPDDASKQIRRPKKDGVPAPTLTPPFTSPPPPTPIHAAGKYKIASYHMVPLFLFFFP